MKFVAFTSIAMAALLSLASAQEAFAHGVSLSIMQPRTRCNFSDNVSSLEMRLRPTLPFEESRRVAVLVQMRPRGTVHLQRLRRLHAFQHQ